MKKTIYILSALILTGIMSSYLTNLYNEGQLEKRKEIAVQFLNAVVNNKNYDTAKQFMGDHLIQHDPEAADGKEQIKSFIEYLNKNHPNSKDIFKQIYADGDHVIIFSHSIRIPDTLGRAIIHIFKIKNNKVVEHWEVTQEVPKKSLNKNTMF